MIDLHTWRQREIQMIGAAISQRNWHGVETAYNQLRDKFDAALATPVPIIATGEVEPDWHKERRTATEIVNEALDDLKADLATTPVATDKARARFAIYEARAQVSQAGVGPIARPIITELCDLLEAALRPAPTGEMGG